MRIQIKTRNNEIRSLYEGHNAQHPNDSGLDLYIPETISIAPQETKIIPLGIQCDAGQGFYVYPRSSISKTPLRLANSVGVIDQGYRGEIMLALTNTMSMPHVKKGEYLWFYGTELISLMAFINAIDYINIPLFMHTSLSYHLHIISMIFMSARCIYLMAMCYCEWDNYLNHPYRPRPVFTIPANTRLAQICAPSLEPIQIEFVDQLNETSRGEGGFGSTGVGVVNQHHENECEEEEEHDGEGNNTTSNEIHDETKRD